MLWSSQSWQIMEGKPPPANHVLNRVQLPHPANSIIYHYQKGRKNFNNTKEKTRMRTFWFWQVTAISISKTIRIEAIILQVIHTCSRMEHEAGAGRVFEITSVKCFVIFWKSRVFQSPFASWIKVQNRAYLQEKWANIKLNPLQIATQIHTF